MKELGLGAVTIEGDSEIVVCAIQSSLPNWTAFGLIIANHNLLRTPSSCLFSHVKRRENVVAHALAKKALDTHDLTVWMGELPQDLGCVWIPLILLKLKNYY